MKHEFLTAEDVANKLGASVPTVRKWVREGRVPAIRLGRFTRIRWEDVVAVMEEDARRQVRDSQPDAKGRFDLDVGVPQ